jgi:hypothetical protein
MQRIITSASKMSHFKHAVIAKVIMAMRGFAAAKHSRGNFKSIISTCQIEWLPQQ